MANAAASAVNPVKTLVAGRCTRTSSAADHVLATLQTALSPGAYMYAHRLLVIGLPALALAACNPFHQSVRVKQDVNYNQRWHGTLTSPAYLAGAVQITGSTTMAPGTDGKKTTITVNVTNAAPGGVHPWEVHLGQCGADQGVFGPMEEYKPIKVNNDGKGETTVVVPMPTPTYGNYFVLLHASTTNRETIIACGNLAPPAP